MKKAPSCRGVIHLRPSQDKTLVIPHTQQACCSNKLAYSGYPYHLNGGKTSLLCVEMRLQADRGKPVVRRMCSKREKKTALSGREGIKGDKGSDIVSLHLTL